MLISFPLPLETRSLPFQQGFIKPRLAALFPVTSPRHSRASLLNHSQGHKNNNIFPALKQNKTKHTNQKTLLRSFSLSASSCYTSFSLPRWLAPDSLSPPCGRSLTKGAPLLFPHAATSKLKDFKSYLEPRLLF